MNWDKEFLSSHSTADQDWANEYSEFTDTDFQSFLEGQKNTTTPAETAYTVNHSKWMLPSSFGYRPNHSSLNDGTLLRTPKTNYTLRVLKLVLKISPKKHPKEVFKTARAEE